MACRKNGEGNCPLMNARAKDMLKCNKRRACKIPVTSGKKHTHAHTEVQMETKPQ